MILTLNERQYVLGMQWSLHPNQAEMRARLKQAPDARYIRNDQHGESNAGIHLGIYDGKIKGKALSAALAIGAVEPSCVIYQRIDDETIWLCVIANGIPYSGKDVLVTPEEADTRLMEALSYCQTIIGDANGATATVPDVLARFESAVKEGRISKKQLAAFTAKAQPKVATRLLIGLGVGALILAAFAAVLFVNKMREQNRLKDLNLKRMMQSEAEQRRIADQKQAAIEKFQADLSARRAALDTAVGTSAKLWNQWQQIRASLPYSQGGYVVTGVVCTEKQCLASWIGSGPLVRTMAKVDLPGYVVADDISSTATTAHPVQPVQGATSPGFDSAIALRQKLVDRLEYAVPGVAVEASAEEWLTPPSDLGLTKQLVGTTGMLKGNFTGPTALITANDFVSAVSDLPVILRKATWSGLDTNTGQGAAVALEAEYVFVGRQK